MLDKHGFIPTWNIGAERSKGYKEEEIIGKHFSIFFPEEDRKDGSTFWANVVKQHTAVSRNLSKRLQEELQITITG